jgi:hypothetical protein
MLRGGLAALMTLALASCTTTQTEFAKNPKEVDKVSLCRTYLQSNDPQFQQQLVAELATRGVSAWDCPGLVQQQNQIATAVVAVALVGGAVAYCSKHHCGGSSYRSYPGNCQYDWQRDAAGNRCGGRSAAARPGGW